MEDEKTKGATKTKKNAPKTNKLSAKKSVAKPKAAPVAKPETESKPKSKAAPDLFDVFVVAKESATIQVTTREVATTDLLTKHADTQIEKLFSGEKAILPTETALYSMDKSKLEALISEKGWNTQVSETSTEADTSAPDGTEAANDLTYVPDEQGAQSQDADQVIDITEPDTPETESDEVNLSDPNEIIYETFTNNLEFSESLNQKENKLMVALIEWRKTIADFSHAEAMTFDSIQVKYAEATAIKDETVTSSPSSEPEADADEQESVENFRKKTEETGLVKSDVIEGLVETEDKTPLSDDERTEFAERQAAIDNAKDAIENAPLIMSQNLAAIRDKRLHRETGLTFAQFVEDRFNITREYAQNLAQGGDFRRVLELISPEASMMAGSVNATNQWLRDTNEIGKMLGVPKSKFGTMLPVIKAVSEIVAEVATDEDGNLNSVAPKIFAAANEKIPEIINTGVIEIGGEQMLIKDALKLGAEFLTEGVKVQIIETVGEQILAKKDLIIGRIKEAQMRRVKPHEAATPPKKDEKFFTGVVLPIYSVTCDRHPLTDKFFDNYIVNVFNAGFETACGCKFQKLTTSGDNFVCIECEGLTIKH